MTPQTVCLLLWLLPHGRDLAACQICRWLWSTICILMFCLLGVMILFVKAAPFIHTPVYQWPRSKAIVGFALYSALAALPAVSMALAVGRIDWAAGLFYGNSAFGHLSKSWKRKTWIYLLTALSNLIVLAALPFHSAKMAFCGMVAATFTLGLHRFDWKGIIVQKPTKSAYIEDMQAAHSSPQNRGPNLLKNFCELEMWEEAAQEFQRLQQNNALKDKEKALWEARIAAGTGQMDKAIRIARQNSPEKAEKLAFLLARLYAQEGKREAALETVAKIGSRRPDPLQIGEVYTALGDNENALRYYERASRFDNKHYLLRNMAAALAALKQHKDAAFLYRDAVYNTPYLATDDLKNLAACYRNVGNERAALNAESLAARGE